MLKQITENLAWIVPSVAIVLAASGVFDSRSNNDTSSTAQTETSVAALETATQPATQFNSVVTQQPSFDAAAVQPTQPVAAPLVTASAATGQLQQEAPATRNDIGSLMASLDTGAQDPLRAGASTPIAVTAAPVQEPEQSTSIVTASIGSQVLAAQPEPSAARERQRSLAAQRPVTTNLFNGFAAGTQNNRCAEDLRIMAADSTVYFASGGIAADATGIEAGRLIGLLAQDCPGVRVMVKGHSDAIGDPALNLKLSQDRAEAVIRRLGTSGMDTSMFFPRGVGSAEPSSVIGPQKRTYYDRRVEFVIVESDQPIRKRITASAAQPWAGEECVQSLQQAVSNTKLFYTPGSVSLPSSDIQAALELAEAAISCPHARLRIVGHHTDDLQARETIHTGIMRAKVLHSMLVRKGAQSEQMIISAPSRAYSTTSASGLPGSRISFDVILEES